MSLSAEFDTAADRRAYALVAAGAAALSYAHARAFFAPFMGTVGASVTPLMLDAVVFWLASANVRQARAGRPLPMLRAGAYALLGLAVTANALGGATSPSGCSWRCPPRCSGSWSRPGPGWRCTTTAPSTAMTGSGCGCGRGTRSAPSGRGCGWPASPPPPSTGPAPSGTGCAPPGTRCGWPCPAAPAPPAVPAPGCCAS